MLISYRINMGTAMNTCEIISGGVSIAANTNIIIITNFLFLLIIAGVIIPTRVRTRAIMGVSKTKPKGSSIIITNERYFSNETKGERPPENSINISLKAMSKTNIYENIMPPIKSRTPLNISKMTIRFSCEYKAGKTNLKTCHIIIGRATIIPPKIATFKRTKKPSVTPIITGWIPSFSMGTISVLNKVSN
jgi:hypothetical protein